MNENGTLYLYRSSEDAGAFLARYGQNASRCAILGDIVVCSAMANRSGLR